ncbi:MAG: class I SAM-dependent methyltransferase [Spirochaetales bacterium]|nr:class I SAM-dependent methyltransferase [Spirochaetales bacterium]
MKTYSSSGKAAEAVSIPCPLCGDVPSTPRFHVEDARFVECSRCTLVYQNPQPLFSDLQGRYRNQYFQYEFSNEENFFNLMLLGMRDIGYTDAFLSAWEDKTFCDIGCATGRLLEHMKHLGFHVEGVELCPESAEYGINKRGVNINIGTLEDTKLPDNSFSIIHFSHLIEHVSDPVVFLLEVRRILKPGGRVIITTPNIAGFQAKLFREKWRSAIRDHLFLFSKKTLSTLLVRLGFHIVTVKTWGGLAVGTAPRWIKRPVDRLAKKWGFGDVMLFLAEKK